MVNSGSAALWAGARAGALSSLGIESTGIQGLCFHLLQRNACSCGLLVDRLHL